MKKLRHALYAVLNASEPDSSDRRIANYLIENIYKKEHFGIQDVADACFVSKSSVSRFCRRIGYADFLAKSSLILKRTKTQKSNRVLYMTKPLKEELLAWLEKLKQDEQSAPEKYSNCGQLFRLPDGLPIAPDVLTKWYRQWRGEHPEFEKIVFHGLRHSSATYQLLQSGGDFKSVQGNTGHATAATLMDTYAHTQDKPRIELAEKIEANFYKQDISGSDPSGPEENKKPEATNITGPVILEAVRQMNPDERRELIRLLFA